jgi:hypothetical protein
MEKIRDPGYGINIQDQQHCIFEPSQPTMTYSAQATPQNKKGPPVIDSTEVTASPPTFFKILM